MSDNGFDQPRPKEPVQKPPLPPHSFYPGSLVSVWGLHGEIESWVVHGFDPQINLFRLVFLTEVNGEKGFIARYQSFQQLSELNNPRDRLRVGALVKVPKDDDYWLVKRREIGTGVFELEKPETLATRTMKLKDLQKLNPPFPPKSINPTPNP